MCGVGKALTSMSFHPKSNNSKNDDLEHDIRCSKGVIVRLSGALEVGT